MTKRVGVLMGGVSSEHDISLKSGAMILAQLSPDQFETVPITIDRQGGWKFSGGDPLPFSDAPAALSALHLDCMYIALHGPFGEDGRIQGLLDLLAISYVGSGCAASALAMDKHRAKAVAENEGIRVARHVIVSAKQWASSELEVTEFIEKQIGYPCVIKSPCQGSSLGMGIPHDRAGLAETMGLVLGFDDEAMVEEFISGREVTCGVLDVDSASGPRALPITEIRPKTSPYFDYEAKYTPGATDEITPADLPEAVARAVSEMAVQAHILLGCRHLSRSDMIISDKGPVWIEVNTLPGMTETSLYPQAAAAAGISFPDLLARFIDAAISE